MIRQLPKGKRRVVRRILPRLLLSVIVFLVFDVLAAQLVKWDKRRRNPGVKHIGLPYEFSFKTNLATRTAMWGLRTYSLRTNSLGFRDETCRRIAATTNVHRIVFIGDSFTMGIGCEYKDTFVGIISRAMSERRVEVLNAAVDGYSTAHYLGKMKHYLENEGLRFDELICCIDLSDIAEDLKVVGWYLGGVSMRCDTNGGRQRQQRTAPRLPRLPHAPRFRHWLRSNSLLVDLVYRIKLQLDPNLPLGEEAALWSSDDAYYERFGRAGMKLAKENMTRLRVLLGEYGIRLTICVYPWADQIVLNDLDSRQVSIWQEWAQQNGAGFINCFPAFIGAYEDPMNAVRKYFIRGDTHYNEAGHRVMADVILGTLLTRMEQE